MPNEKQTQRSAQRGPGPRPWLVRSREWIAIAILAPFAVAAMLSPPLVPNGTFMDFVFDAMAWVCFVVGALFRWWATLYLGGRKNRELTTDGPYSMCRNPLYFGTFMLTLSIAFYLHSITFAVGMAAATPTYLQITVPWEEKILRRAFGERFDRYRRETTRFWPDFRLLRMPSTLTVKVDGLKAEFYRSLHWMWIPLIAQALADLRMEAWWPLKMNLP